MTLMPFHGMEQNDRNFNFCMAWMSRGEFARDESDEKL
jgi:hypothetical protein